MAFTVGIVGLGTMGSMALWQLARRGIAVEGFEQFDLGHENGAFSGETRMFRTAYANGGHWAPALVAARALWRELERESGWPLLDLNGFASIAPPSTPNLEKLIHSAAVAGLQVETLSSDQAQSRFPALGVRTDEIAVFDKAGGLIKPERSVMAALERACALSAKTHGNSRVLGIEPAADSVTIVTANDRRIFDAVIVTTGSWASALLGRELVVPHRVGLHWYLAKRPELFAPAGFPSHIRYAGGRSICLFSMQDGTTVKAAIGGSLGRLDDPLDARTAGESERQELSDAIASHYPDLWPHPVRSQSYADGFTSDGDAVIGLLPECPRVAVAAGFSAHGFKIAPVVGAALADLALEGQTRQPLAHLALERLRPAPSVHADGFLPC